MSPQIKKLTGSELERFWQILLAEHNLTSLRMMLKFKLDKELDEITAPGPLQTVVFELLDVSQMEGWTYRLLLAARETRPDDPELLAFAQEVGLAPLGMPQQAGLEKIIEHTGALLDVMKWRVRLGQIEGQVCRVEMKGRGIGTGFLIGPDLVITNWHVVNTLKDQPGEYKPGDVVLRFDYKRLEDGVELNKGREYKLVMDGDNWLVDHSPWSPVDLQLDPKTGSPQADELDYALLRVAGLPGNEPIGEKAQVGAPPRGWIATPDKAFDFQVDTPLFIVQHPEGAPLQLALNGKVLGVHGDGRRVRYSTNTKPGSSGSPVFDQHWNLVALHHSGDPKSILPTYNEGIPFKLIVDRLQEQGAL